MKGVTLHSGPDALRFTETCSAIHRSAFSAQGVRGWSAAEVGQLLDRDSAILLRAPGGFLLADLVLDEAEIVTVAVLPQHQSKGAGRAMLETLLDACTGRSVRRIFLEVAIDNVNALALYRSIGFTEVGFRKDYFRTDDGLTSAHVMEKLL